MAGAVRRRGGQAIRAVDMEPDLVAADLGEAGDVVDRARERRAGGGDHGYRGHAVSLVVVDRFGAGGDVHPSVFVDRDRANVAPADPEHLGGAAHRVVRFGRAVQRHLPVAGALVTDAGQRPFARRGERSQVRDRAARRQQPARVLVEADELPDPADRLRLEQVGRAGAVSDVDVVGGHQRVGQHADLEPRGPDIREPPRPGLRQRAVEHVGSGVERF